MNGELRVRDRFARRAIRAAGTMPKGMQLALSGGRRVVVDGQELDPGIQLFLAAYRRRNDPPAGSVPLDVARRDFGQGARITGGSPEKVGDVRDLVVEGAGGGLAARLYVPDEPRPDGIRPPVIVYFHGGGFVFGGIETHDVPCRILCKHSGAMVLSVDYGLAPEHPFPEPVEDAHAALRWALENAGRLGADPERVAVGGDSAGGALAANAAAMMAGENGPVMQLLIYPVTDVAGGTRSRELFAEGFVLDRALLDWFELQYAPNADAEDPRLSVAKTDPDVLAAMPPTVLVTAGFDPLRDEGERYARALAEAGVPVVARRFPGLIHGFMNLAGVNRASLHALVETAGTARAMLGPKSVRG